MRMNRPIVVVPHTHWDREWYLPFQRFRLRLVSLLDQVIDRMEADPRLRFTLDGQMAAVDDYLEVRPERRDRVAALVRDGRLAVGPWQILHDEFLCSGETIVRNLELGMQRARAMGAAMMVGYLPDEFGHCAQTPQILRLAGISQACLWRGVPAEVRGHAFAWVAPDGTSIRTEYMPEGGYGNAAGMFDEPGLLARRADDFARRMEAWHPGEEPLLAMYGADHTAPAADLADQLAAVPGLRLDTLAGYFAHQQASADGLPQIHGELRSHARANILPGVLSARIHLKQAMGRAECLVERYAEPLAALWLPEYPQRFLDMAWQRLIEVSCHDSVTGCGSDETAEQVAARMAEAEQLGRAVCDLVTAELAAAVPADAHLVLNPTPAPRTSVVTVDVPAARDAPTVLDDDLHRYADLPIVLARIYGRELFGQQITAWSVSLPERTLTFHVAPHSEEPFDIADVRDALVGADGDWRVRILAAAHHTVSALVTVPPLGYVAVRPEPPAEPAVQVTGDTLDNGLLRVEVLADGTFSLHGRPGIGRIVDGGDAGDTYNHAPPIDDRLISEPVSVRVERARAEPLIAALDVVRTYRWPARGDAAGRATDTEDATVTMRVELRAAEPFVRLRITFGNRCEDHRVRLHLPLPRPAHSSFAEGQFAVVERALTAEGGCGEEPIPTYPASGFVAAGGLAVLLEHVSEYEVTDSGRELALTLLRSVGWLSRNRNAYRDAPAGPQVPTPRAQCLGERTVELAIMPYEGDRPGPGVHAAAETFRHDLLAIKGTGPLSAPLPPARAGVEVTGAMLTSLRRRDGHLEARLVNQDPQPTSATITGADPLPLRPWEIATVRLGPDSSSSRSSASGAYAGDGEAFDVGDVAAGPGGDSEDRVGGAAPSDRR